MVPVHCLLTVSDPRPEYPRQGCRDDVECRLRLDFSSIEQMFSLESHGLVEPSDV